METPAGGVDAVETFYGRVDIKVTTAGAVTGTLRTRAGKSYAIKTSLSEGTGSASQRNVGLAPLKGTTNVFLINFRLTVNADGTVNVAGENFNPGDANAIFFTAGSLKFLSFTGKPGNTPAWLGNYTLALLAPKGAPATVPAGAGYASLTVNTVGKLLYTGKLGDGTKFTGSADPSSGAVYSIYAVPPGYAAGGYILAELDLDKRGEQTGSSTWNKPAKAADKAYPTGFTTDLVAVVQPWLVPAKKAYPIAASLGFGSSKNFSIDYSGEGLVETDFSTTLPDTARITGLATIQAVSGATGTPAENNSKAWNALWNVKLNPATGVFTGKQTLKRTVNGKPATIIADIEGVLSLADTLSTAPFAYGQYRVPNVSGLVTFAGPLENNTLAGTAGSYTSVAVVDLPDANDQVSEPKPKLPAILSSKASYKEYDGFHAGERRVEIKADFTVAEDLSSVKFMGVTLPVSQAGIPPLGGGLVVYTNAPKSPMNSITLFVGRDSTTGIVTGYIATFTTVSGFTPLMVTISCADNAGSSYSKPFTSITKL